MVDPLIVGLPVVARRGRKLRTAQATSLLEMEGLETAICADTEAYIDRAARLAADPAFREAEAGRIRNPAKPSLTCLRTAPLAAKFDAFCAQAVSASRMHLDHLRGASDDALRDMIRQSLKLAFDAPSPAFQRLTGAELVAQLLVPWLETLVGEGRATGRVIEVGAGFGAQSKLFLRAGFQVDMFEPDPDCAAQLAGLVSHFSGLAAHQASAVVWEPAASVSFNKRAVGSSSLGASPAGAGAPITVPATTLAGFLAERPGIVDIVMISAEGADFDILKSLELSATAPKVVMAGFSPAFPDQSIEAVRSVVQWMEARGYGAVLFEYKTLPGLGGTSWSHQLVDVAFDADRLGQGGDAFGNVLFYQRADTGLAASLAQLIETYGPAQTRPAFMAMGRPAEASRRTRKVRAHDRAS